MTLEALLKSLERLRTSTDPATGRQNPHKPILLLLLLRQMLRSGSSGTLFADIAPELGELIERYGSASMVNAADRAAMPFVQLEREVWVPTWGTNEPLEPGTPERSALLTEREARGELSPEVLDALTTTAQIREASEHVLITYFDEAAAARLRHDLGAGETSPPLSPPETTYAASAKGRLSQLTDPAAVNRAITEFHEFGREGFLQKYGLAASRDFFVHHDGILIDSRPLLAVAYGYQHPDHGPLRVKDFPGGTNGAVRALSRLGFTTVTRVQIRPPSPGEEHPHRTAISNEYGGDTVAGINRFPGDPSVNIFSDAKGPYADDPPTLTEPFGYRGEGLTGPQRLNSRGNTYLEDARTTRSPVRFWYRPAGGQFSFVTWVAVLGRTWVAGVGQDGQTREELEWQVKAVSVPDTSRWPATLLQSLKEATETTDDDADVPEAHVVVSYIELINRVDARGQQRRPTGVIRTDYARSAAARRAVLIRCADQCESPRCTGMPAELNRRGEPILDVDHIKDLGLGGEDHPRNMIALCPNCHACKTRGGKVSQWRRELTMIATVAHDRAMAKFTGVRVSPDNLGITDIST
jgi:5-methylcytosine-specific restriction protein A